MRPLDDMNTPVIALVGIVGAILFVVLVLGLQVWFFDIQEIETYKKDISQAPEEITALISRQQDELREYRWVDKKNKIVGIPIERAMDLVVADLAAGRPPLRITTRPVTSTKRATTRRASTRQATTRK